MQNLCRRASLASEPGEKILHFDLMLDRWLLREDAHGRKTLTDFTHPVILLQACESSSDGFVQSLRRDINLVLDVANISYPNRAGA